MFYINKNSLKNIVVIVYLLGVFYFTLFWRSEGFQLEYQINLNIIPFYWLIEPLFMGKDFYLSQVYLNIILFVPLGFLSGLFSKDISFKKVFITSLCFTLFIELIQPFFGRCTDIDDVMLNVIGGCLGYSLFTAIKDKILLLHQDFSKAKVKSQYAVM